MSARDEMGDERYEWALGVWRRYCQTPDGTRPIKRGFCLKTARHA